MRKKVIIGLMIITLIWIGNIWYYLGQQLKEPIFMKHYYEEMIASGSSFRIAYLINKNRDIDVSWIEIPGIVGPRIDINQFPRDTFTHHMLKEIFVTISEDDIEQLIGPEGLVIDHIIAHYTNGESKKVSIGEIRMSQYKPWGDDDPIDWKSSGGSSNHTGFSMLKIKKDMTITDIESYWMDDLKGFLQVYINADQNQISKPAEELSKDEEKEYNNYDNHKELQDMLYSLDGLKIEEIQFPFILKKQDNLKINYSFLPEENDSRSYNYYVLNLIMTGKTSDGTKFSKGIRVDYNPYFNDSDIRKMIKERR